MSSELQSIEDFLGARRKVGLRVTIQPIEANADAVLVSPWTSEGCLCGSGIPLLKKAIKGVTATGLIAQCCSRQLAVVILALEENSLVSAEHALSQLARAGDRPFVLARPSSFADQSAKDMTSRELAAIEFFRGLNGGRLPPRMELLRPIFTDTRKDNDVDCDDLC